MFSTIASAAAILGLLPSLLAAPMPLSNIGSRSPFKRDVSTGGYQPDCENREIGYISVYDSNNDWVGYFADVADEAGTIGDIYTNSTDEAFVVSFCGTPYSETIYTVTLNVVDPQTGDIANGSPFLALVQGSNNIGNGDIGADTSNYLILSLSDTALDVAQPQYEDNLFNEVQGSWLPDETSVWNYDPSTECLTNVWVNNDNAIEYTRIVHTYNSIYFTAGFDDFVAQYGGEEYFLTFQSA